MSVTRSDMPPTRRCSTRRGRAPTLVAAVALVALASACGQLEPAQAAPTAPAGPAPVPPASATPTTAAVPPAALPEPRPPNGEIITRTSTNGLGELVVDNGTDDDAYLTMAVGRDVAVAIYVHARSTARARNIPDGTYTLYVAAGHGWNSNGRTFTTTTSAQQFNQRFPYTTTDTTTEWSITVHPVQNGNAQTSPVPSELIPR